MCEGTPLSKEELPESVPSNEQAKTNDGTKTVTIKGKKFKTATFWGEDTEYGSTIFPPCFSAQADARSAALELCMSTGFPKSACNVVEITTLGKGSAFFHNDRNTRTYCTKKVLIEAKIAID